ncbi:Zonadhesin [Lamellibrachia satsuma]|nr:Zonadhesin [Lamellibrachia satsuma]
MIPGNACLSAPCQNDGWCITGGDDYVCQCRVGYEGKNCENKVATCYVSGDPHIGTFDGLMVHYQGVCRYNLASSRENYPDLPYFRVLAKSERRHGNMHVSYPRYVDIEVFGRTIRLDKNKKVYVDGVSVQPDATFPGFEITNNGRFVRLATNFSLVVESDGDWLTVVKAPNSFAGKMAGLCGNDDGDKENDWRLSNGTNVKALPNKYSLLGNSWQVEDPEDATCETTNDPDPQECDAAMAATVSSDAYCGLMGKPDGIFRNCIRRAPDLANSNRENCQFDACANMGNVTSVKRAVCGTLEAFSVQCSDRGYGQVDWRTAANCPLDCGPDMIYKLSAPACHPTCSKPNAPEECGLPKTESCVCADNDAVVVNGRCVSANTCGCTDDNGVHHEIGNTWLNEDCSVEFNCNVCTSCKRPVGEIVSHSTSCTEGYECSLDNDHIGTCQKAAQWTDWLPWGGCSESCGKGIQTRTRQCLDKDHVVVSDGECDGLSAETRDCICDMNFYAPVDCVTCTKTSNYVGYVADVCDCSQYYHCQLANGAWTATPRRCLPCLLWDSAKLTCVRSSDIKCDENKGVVTCGNVKSVSKKAVFDNVDYFVRVSKIPL